MVYNTGLLGFWTLSIVRYSRKYKTRRFGNWICFRLQMRGKTTLLHPLEIANLNHWTNPLRITQLFNLPPN
jgi:hypothetical protein